MFKHARPAEGRPDIKFTKNCFFVFFNEEKKWMGPAYRAGQELSENSRNIHF